MSEFACVMGIKVSKEDLENYLDKLPIIVEEGTWEGYNGTVEYYDDPEDSSKAIVGLAHTYQDFDETLEYFQEYVINVLMDIVRGKVIDIIDPEEVGFLVGKRVD